MATYIGLDTIDSRISGIIQRTANFAVEQSFDVQIKEIAEKIKSMVIQEVHNMVIQVVNNYDSSKDKIVIEIIIKDKAQK